MSKLVGQGVIIQKVFVLRGQKVMFDSDLAELYGVTTGNLNKAVRRNIKRFPKDFMFHLINAEFERLRFQIGISKRGGRRYLPYAFTEHGIAMLSSIINSERAIQVNILIIRVFIKLRKIFSAHRELAHKVSAIERRVAEHDNYIGSILNAIKELKESPIEGRPKRKIGFRTD